MRHHTATNVFTTHSASSSLQPLRDTTNCYRSGTGGTGLTPLKPIAGARCSQQNDALLANGFTNATPKATLRRPHTPQSGGATQPHRGQHLTGTTTATASKTFASPSGTTSRFSHLTPQKPLFQRSLLREIAPGDEAPHLTVVLDLDETLVSNRRADLPHAILRPYVIDVLAALRALPGVEVVMWTASTEETGSQVLRQLHAHGEVFDDVIYRNDDWFTEPVHTKDLRLLGRDMDRVVVIDNAPNCCKLNKYNAVLIDDFAGAVTANDHSLVNMLHTIQQLLEGVRAGASVGKTLERLSEGGDLCYRVHYPVPDAWAHVRPRDVAPLMYPPHGTFFKLRSTITQRHTFRMH